MSHWLLWVPRNPNDGESPRLYDLGNEEVRARWVAPGEGDLFRLDVAAHRLVPAQIRVRYEIEDMPHIGTSETHSFEPFSGSGVEAAIAAGREGRAYRDDELASTGILRGDDTPDESWPESEEALPVGDWQPESDSQGIKRVGLFHRRD